MNVWPPGAADVAVLTTSLLASLWDVRTRRIPNALTLGSAAIALAFFTATSHDTGHMMAGFGWSAAGWGLGFLLFLPVFLLGGLGAGDVKLLAALGAWLGPATVCWAALYASVAGGVMALPLLLWKRALGQTLWNVYGLLTFWRVSGLRPHPALTLEAPGGLRLPYALPIAMGACMAMWWRQ